MEKDFKSGIAAGKNLSNKQKAIFLDRDGTMNKYAGFLRGEKEFELLEGVAAAIKEINMILDKILQWEVYMSL